MNATRSSGGPRRALVAAGLALLGVVLGPGGLAACSAAASATAGAAASASAGPTFGKPNHTALSRATQADLVELANHSLAHL